MLDRIPKISRATEQYEYPVVRRFIEMAVVWGILGMLVGVYLAGELAFPDWNLHTPVMSFGRLRPVHTTLMLFGFCGSLLFSTAYYVLQRTCQVRLAYPALAQVTFLGWQAVLVSGILSELLGYVQAREYAEFEWPIDLLLIVVWGLFLWVYISTLRIRSQPILYVANWFFFACLLAVALLHTVGNLAVPVGFMKSYSLFSGVQDAMIQWWYAHNMLLFLMNVSFLGMMYYFLPKQAGRPLYSYRLSILHFWSLMFLSFWIGPVHLLWTALPDWAATLGVSFAILLLYPALAGVINGLMTLSGAWDQVRKDPILLFFSAGLVLYGITISEGVFLSLETVNAVSHYTDLTIAHAHLGGMGWASMTAFGVMYYLVPRLWNTKIYSTRLMSIHFWFALTGALTHAIALWTAGIKQGLQLQSLDNYGNLSYGFLETLKYLRVPYLLRGVGGGLFLLGGLLLAYNLLRTILQARRERVAVEARIAAKMSAAAKKTGSI
ncbi:Cbb3-type cytochrome c oxidase subunit CcoN1 [Gammaproteobacteria bacterium]